MADGLFLPDGTFLSFNAAELTTQLATRQNAGVTLGELEGWLNTLPDPDPVLRKRGEDATVLDDLSADDQVTTAMLSRKNRVLNCPDFTLRAGARTAARPPRKPRRCTARFVQDLERTNLRTVISGILDAPFFGFIPLELIWRPGDNWWHLVDIVPRPPRWFRFDNENRPTFVGVYGGIAAQPVPLPAGKFVFVQHHATYDNPYGLRLLSRWPPGPWPSSAADCVFMPSLWSGTVCRGWSERPRPRPNDWKSRTWRGTLPAWCRTPWPSSRTGPM